MEALNVEQDKDDEKSIPLAATKNEKTSKKKVKNMGTVSVVKDKDSEKLGSPVAMKRECVEAEES